MPEVKDLWYIRLPDGRILRAAGPAVIRQQLAAGRLPPGTRVRQTLDEDWQPVERLPEFADTPLHHTNGTAPATIASRLDPTRLGLAGVRYLGEELLGALDSTLCASKLRAATLAGLLLGGLAGVELLGRDSFVFALPWLTGALAAIALLVWSWLGLFLSRMTFTEVSRLRPAGWKDGLAGGVASLFHLALAQGLVLAVLTGALLGARLLPSALPGGDSGATFAILSQVSAAIGLILEFLLWPVFLLTLPLPAIVAIEQGSFVSALGQWFALVRRRTGRLLLAESLALGIGLVIAAPLALLGALLTGRAETIGLEAVAFTRCTLLGLLAGVFLAYLVVANVFIYLNLRYDERE